MSKKRVRVKPFSDEECPYTEPGTPPSCIGMTGEYLGVVLRYKRDKFHGVKFDDIPACGCEKCCFDRRDLEFLEG